MPMSRALRLCPDALVVPVPRAVCGVKSREIRDVLGHFTPVVQAASIDEWYLDLTGTEALYHHEPLRETAHRIRRAVRDATGLTVSIGGGTNRLVAKLAVERAKPKPGSGADGVHIVGAGDEAAFMATVALGDIPGVGPRFRERLAAAGLERVPDVLAADPARLRRLLGDRGAEWLTRKCRADDQADVRERDAAKSISHEETFGRDLDRDEDLGRELVDLVRRVAHHLRRDGLMARTVSVKLRDADFRTRGASRTLPHGVIADRVILATAHELLAKLRRARRAPARLLGVALTGLEDADAEAQLALFDDSAAGVESEKDRRLARAVDAVREKFGAEAVVPAPVTTRAPRRR